MKAASAALAAALIVQAATGGMMVEDTGGGPAERKLIVTSPGAYRAEVVTWPGAPYTNSDFVVHGWIDIDGDGQVAHYTATKSIRTTLVTDPGVY